MLHTPSPPKEATGPADPGLPAEGNREARFAALLRSQYGRLQRVARSYAPPGEHEDLLQDMLVRIWRALPGFDGRASVSSWAWRIALNTAFDALRTRYARPAMQVMAHDDLLPLSAASVGDPTDPDDLLQSFLRQLSPMDRAVLMLSLDDQPYTEIARITGLNANAVGIRLTRIKQRFNQDYVEDQP